MWDRNEIEKDKDTEGKGDGQQDEISKREEQIKESGQLVLSGGKIHKKIHLMTIIGEIEGHENLNGSSKTTKYEHILPQLAAIEDDPEIKGVLVLLNTMGGDVDAGLAIAEMIASLSKPTVSLVLGGSHSIGVPLAVSTDYSFIVPSGTMLVHPVRMSGLMIGARQTYEYFQKIQDRITGFVAAHSHAKKERLEEMMMETGEMTKDLGTILVGENAVKEGLIDAVGGIDKALQKLHEFVEQEEKEGDDFL